MEKNLRIAAAVILLIGAVAFWRVGSESIGKKSLSATGQSVDIPIDLNKLQKHVSSLVLSDPKISAREHDLAGLGRKLFFDARLSKGGQISCASCHQPEKSFTDGLQFGHGIGITKRNTPSVVNSFAMFWFFWDGRADSLAAQALQAGGSWHMLVVCLVDGPSIARCRVVCSFSCAC